jgi:hypothetical protein
MRFNPLWLLVLFLLIPWIAAPLLLMALFLFAVMAFLLFAGGVSPSAGSFCRRLPGDLWNLLSSARCRANFALFHAAARLLAERGMALDGRAEKDGFFLYGDISPALAYEVSVQALARLKNGEKTLAVYPACRTSRTFAGVILAVIFMIFLSPGGVLGVLAAAAGGYFLSPYASPYFQSFLLKGAPVERISVQGVSQVFCPASSFPGGNASEQGVKVSTSETASAVIEAEIVQE